MAAETSWTWRPHATGERPQPDAMPLTIRCAGDTSTGEMLYEVVQDEGTPALTAREWAAFAMWLMSDGPGKGGRRGR